MSDAVLIQRLSKVRNLGFANGIVGILGCACCAWAKPTLFFIGYLSAYLFWIGLPLGALAVLMIYHLTGGRWGWAIRRTLEAILRLLPWMAVGFFPILVGLRKLYAWTSGTSETTPFRQFYLSPMGFVVRAILFFAVWLILSAYLLRWSTIQDKSEDPEPGRRMQILSGPGLVLLGFSLTFATIDWVMSLEPDWYSSIFALIVIMGQILSALAVSTLLVLWFSDQPPFQGRLTPIHFRQLGNLVLTFVLLWTYMNLGQLIIIWSGNLPKEIGWYLHRTAGGWTAIVLFLFAFHFVLPFFLLLWRDGKQRRAYLTGVLSLILVARFADDLWLVAPTFAPLSFESVAFYLISFLGLGGINLGLFCIYLAKYPLLPLNDLREEPVIMTIPTS